MTAASAADDNHEPGPSGPGALPPDARAIIEPMPIGINQPCRAWIDRAAINIKYHQDRPDWEVFGPDYVSTFDKLSTPILDIIDTKSPDELKYLTWREGIKTDLPLEDDFIGDPTNLLGLGIGKALLSMGYRAAVRGGSAEIAAAADGIATSGSQLRAIAAAGLR